MLRLICKVYGLSRLPLFEGIMIGVETNCTFVSNILEGCLNQSVSYK